MSRTRAAPAVIACLGDSLTFGAQTPEILHPWTDLCSVDPRVFPQVTLANHGKNSDVLAGFHERYTESIKGQGYSGLVIQAPINDVQAGTSAATICAALQALVDEAIADGLPVILLITSPAGNFSTWNPTKQGVLEACRTYMLAMTGLAAIVDLYDLMGSDSDPTKLADDFDYGDGLHDSAEAVVFKAGLVAAEVAELFPAPVVPEALEITLPQRSGPYVVKRGDLRPSLRMKLLGRDGAPLPLPDGSTVRFRMRLQSNDSGDLKIDELATIEDAETATVRYDFAGTDTDTVGLYVAEFRRVLTGAQETVPGDTFLRILVADPA